MLLFVLLRHVLWLGLVPFPRNVKVCGCPRMTSRTHPHGPRPSLCLRDIHKGLPANYDCKDSAPPPAQPGVRARPGRNSQDGVSQQQETAPLFLPQLNRLHCDEASGEDASNVAVAAIPVQNRLTHQIIQHWQPFKDLKQTFAVSRAFTHSSASCPL